jgi:rubrerythrin
MESPHEKIRSLSTAKALTIAAYGEAVAAYRYRTLAEKTTDATQHRLFVQIADEEQGHHAAVQELLQKHFPDSDFLLTAEDKELVIVGPRMLDCSGQRQAAHAMELIQASERRTGAFYAALSDATPRADLQPIFRAMANECFEHAEQLSSVVPALAD